MKIFNILMLMGILMVPTLSVASNSVEKYCESEWPGDYQTQQVCIKYDGKDVFAHNTAKYKYRKFRKYINGRPALLKTAPELQYDATEAGIATAAWTLLIIIPTL